MTLSVVSSLDVGAQEVQSIEWNSIRYVYHPTKLQYVSAVNPENILKTKAWHIVRRCQLRRDGNLLVEIDEKILNVPIVLTPNGEEYGALSLAWVGEMVRDITSKVINAWARKLWLTQERYQSPILRK